MIWLVWRQHRAQALAGVLLVVLTTSLSLWYGLSMRNAYAQDGIGACMSGATGGSHCQSMLSAFMSQFNGVANHLLSWFSPVPGLIGAIVGATVLGREYEHGTWRFVWTQAVPRTRWLTAKILMIGAGVVAVTATLSVVFAWFRSPMDQVSGRFTPGAFDLEGLSLTGYTLFAFGLGVLAGLLLRRTVPAIVTAFLAFLAVRLPVEYWLRQRYQTPVTRLVDATTTFTQGPGSVPSSPGQRGWILSADLTDSAGHVLSASTASHVLDRANQLSSPPAGDAYLRALGIHLKILYQPADRFWTFQIIEAGLFIGLAAVLLSTAVYRLRNRGT